MSDYPPFLQVGTEISAKFKGAFCEAKIKKASRCVKCRVVFKDVQIPSVVIDENALRGSIRLGVSVDAPHPETKLLIPATIHQIKDCSTYTVVFDDGDEKVLRRSQMCLKGGRHFDESESLDVMPLTKPEQFGAPVRSKSGAKTKGANKSSSDSDSDSDSATDHHHRHGTPTNKKSIERRSTRQTPIPPAASTPSNSTLAEYGRVVCVFEDAQQAALVSSGSQAGSGKATGGSFGQGEKRKWYPAMIVSQNAQRGTKLKIREECFVRSFKDGKYQVVPRVCVKDFDIEKAKQNDLPSLKLAIEKAILYLEKDDLPFHWDRELLMGETNDSRSDSCSDEDTASDIDSGGGFAASSRPIVSEKKDRFVAQLYKYMDELGTPINKAPILAQKDLDLYRLFETVKKLGGYNRVCLKNEWKTVLKKLKLDGLPGATPPAVRSAYNKYLSQFEAFWRKLGCQMDETSRRERHASKSQAKINDKAAESAPPRNKEDQANKKPSLMKRTVASRFLSTSSSSKQVSSPSTASADPVVGKMPTVSTSTNVAVDSMKIDNSTNILVESMSNVESVKSEPCAETPEIKDSQSTDSVADETDSYKVGQKLKVQYGHGHHGKVYVAKILKAEGRNRYLVHYLGWNTRYDEIIDGSRVLELLAEESDHETPTSASPKPKSAAAGSLSKFHNSRDRRNTGENLSGRKRRSSGGSTHSLVYESTSGGKTSPFLRKSGKKIARKSSPSAGELGGPHLKPTADRETSTESSNNGQKTTRHTVGRRSASSTPIPPIGNSSVRTPPDGGSQQKSRRKLSAGEKSGKAVLASSDAEESNNNESDEETSSATVRRVSKRLRGEKPSGEENAKFSGTTENRTSVCEVGADVAVSAKEEDNSNDSFKLLDFTASRGESESTYVSNPNIKTEIAHEEESKNILAKTLSCESEFTNVKEEPQNDEELMEVEIPPLVDSQSLRSVEDVDNQIKRDDAQASVIHLDTTTSEPSKSQDKPDENSEEDDDDNDDDIKLSIQEISAHVKATISAVVQNRGVASTTATSSNGAGLCSKNVRNVVAKKVRTVVVKKQKPKRRRRNYSNMVTECRKQNKQTPKKEVESDNEGVSKIEGSPKDPNSLHALRQRIQMEISHDPNYKPLYTFNVMDETLDGERRIQVLQQRLTELKETYAQVKSEWTYLERKRKKHLEKKRRQQQRLLNANNKRTSTCDSNEEQRKVSCESTPQTTTAESPAKTSSESRDPSQ